MSNSVWNPQQHIDEADRLLVTADDPDIHIEAREWCLALANGHSLVASAMAHVAAAVAVGAL